MSEALYLIRKGGAYYRPNSQGYTRVVEEAGRYTLEEAIAITHPNGFSGSRDGMDYAEAPAPERAAPIPALLPCPFCGVDGAIEEGFPGHFMAICMSCYCNVGENVEPTTCAAKHMFESYDEAAEAWNRRADREARPSLPDNREEQIRAEAAEDERDRLYAEACKPLPGEENETIAALACAAATWLRLTQGVQPPARSRQEGNNG